MATNAPMVQPEMHCYPSDMVRDQGVCSAGASGGPGGPAP